MTMLPMVHWDQAYAHSNHTTLRIIADIYSSNHILLRFSIAARGPKLMQQALQCRMYLMVMHEPNIEPSRMCLPSAAQGPKHGYWDRSEPFKWETCVSNHLEASDSVLLAYHLAFLPLKASRCGLERDLPGRQSISDTSTGGWWDHGMLLQLAEWLRHSCDTAGSGISCANISSVFGVTTPSSDTGRSDSSSIRDSLGKQYNIRVPL